jgi:hypothetical protein
MIFIPSESIAFANCLASLSVRNVFVRLIDADDFNRHCFGASNETNHRLVVTERLAKMGNPIGALRLHERLCHVPSGGNDSDQLRFCACVAGEANDHSWRIEAR